MRVRSDGQALASRGHSAPQRSKRLGERGVVGAADLLGNSGLFFWGEHAQLAPFDRRRRRQRSLNDGDPRNRLIAEKRVDPVEDDRLEVLQLGGKAGTRPHDQCGPLAAVAAKLQAFGTAVARHKIANDGRPLGQNFAPRKAILTEHGFRYFGKRRGGGSRPPTAAVFYGFGHCHIMGQRAVHVTRPGGRASVAR